MSKGMSGATIALLMSLILLVMVLVVFGNPLKWFGETLGSITKTEVCDAGGIPGRCFQNACPT